jgi:hypothetical protein
MRHCVVNLNWCVCGHEQRFLQLMRRSQGMTLHTTCTHAVRQRVWANFENCYGRLLFPNAQLPVCMLYFCNDREYTQISIGNVEIHLHGFWWECITLLRCKQEELYIQPNIPVWSKLVFILLRMNKAAPYGREVAGMTGLNPAAGMVVSLMSSVCC